MVTKSQVLTADDILDLPVLDDALGYELVDGHPEPVMPSSPLHGELVGKIYLRLETHVQSAALPGKVYIDAGFVLGLARDPERMRGPDVSYVSREKVESHPNPERFFRCVPDLAVEVDVTSGRKPGGQQRVVDYLEAGVPLVWAIDPRSRTVTAYRPDGSATLLRPDEVLEGEDVVPGFRLELSELFG